MLTLTIDTTRGRRRLELLGASLADVQASLRPFGKYLRNKAKQRFAAEGPGWPALAQSTGHRLIHTRTSRVTVSGHIREGERFKLLRQQLQRDVRSGRANVELLLALHRSTRATGGGALGEALRRNAASWGDKPPRYARELSNIARDLDREHAGKKRKRGRAIARHKLLGKLAGAMFVAMERRAVLVGNRVAWAGVHNEGGAAGRGATIPARTFNEIEPEDIDVLVDLIFTHARAAAAEPAGGITTGS